MEIILKNFSEINWVQVFAGSLIPVLIYFFQVITTSVKNKKLNNCLVGDWYSYHYSRRNFNPTFRKAKWEIRANYFRRSLVIKITDEDKNKTELKYFGRVKFDDNYIAINLTGKNHSEIVQTRLLKPIPNDDTIMLGFELAKDFDHEIYTSVVFICKNKRTDNMAKTILKESVEWYEDEQCIRLSKKPVATDSMQKKQELNSNKY